MNNPMTSFTRKHHLRDWHHLLWWFGAVLIGLMAFLLAQCSAIAYGFFIDTAQKYPWFPFVFTPIAGIFLTWFMRKVGEGTEGSGIQQAIAALDVADNLKQIHWFINLKLAVAKFFAIILGLGSGFVVGLEGPTVQIGASIMYTFRRFLPTDVVATRRQLIIMGGSAGIAAAFNAPMAGVMFAFEEMWRSVEYKTASHVAVAIMLAGFTAYWCNGKSSYFGYVDVSLDITLKYIPIALLVIIISALIGGALSWLMVRPNKWLPNRVIRFKKSHPYYFVIGCALLLASCGTFAPIFGSGAGLTQQMLHNEVNVAWYYMPLKFIAFLSSSLTGVPGGIFSPSLSLGAGVGNCFTDFIAPEYQTLTLILGMVAVLAAITRAPLTATFIMIEMTGNHTIIFVVLVAAVLADYIARIFNTMFYHDLADDALKDIPVELASNKTPT